MPKPAEPTKTLEQLVEELGVYPPDAFDFIQEGLGYTVAKLHKDAAPDQDRHISGRELCEGLRDLALARWGFMAGVVLRRWNISSTLDFGRIVFALVNSGFLSKTDRDSLDDFRGIYDFPAAFDAYRVGKKT